MLKIELIVLCEQAPSLNYLNSERMAELLLKNLKIYSYILTKYTTMCSIKINTTYSRRNKEGFIREGITKKGSVEGTMSEVKLGAVEAKFADIIWSNEPLRTGVLVKLAEEELNWKRTTTFTILKRLCDRGIFQNKDRIVTSLISKEEFYALQSERFVNDTFKGSLPAFLASFGTRKKLSEEEVEELKKVIGGMRR